MDDDCTPAPGHPRRLLRGPAGEGAGAIAGEILGEEGQRALAARYARDRKVLSQTDGLYGRGRTIAATGNLMVRRSAFEALGGFVEGIRSAGDVDFCLRLQEAGWELDFRPTHTSATTTARASRACCAPSPGMARGRAG